MTLFFNSLYRKIEEVNRLIMESIVNDMCLEKYFDEITELEDKILDATSGAQRYYTQKYLSLKKDVDKQTFANSMQIEMKEIEVITKALRITVNNHNQYMKYIYTKDRTIEMKKLILFNNQFEPYDEECRMSIEQLISKEESCKLFYSPIGYCEEKLDIGFSQLSSNREVIQSTCNSSGIMNLEPQDYVNKWEKVFNC
ncbi:hypothetical protein FG335_14410 [Listeria monocytogenes]|nr:hypothetical protein [Listeria monocytogenes]